MGKININWPFFYTKSGFTITEVLVTISVIAVLAMTSIPLFNFFQKKTELNQAKENVINALRLAQKKTIASHNDSPWGIYFATTTDPDQCILFQGENYVSRVTSSDEIYKLTNNTQITNINIVGNNEVVFNRLEGTTNNSGILSLALINDPNSTTTIYIDQSGQVGHTSFPSPSDSNRVVDSRHIHFTYDRAISTSTESIILTFNGSITETIVIADNLNNGQIYWAGEIDVNGYIQTLTIQTLRINDPDSLFCVYRDRRHNNKILDIDIDGDGGATPNLIRYSADGLTTTEGSSLFVSEPIWQ